MTFSTKPDSLRSRLRAALAAITDPLGATYEQLRDTIGVDSAQFSRVVHCLSKTKHIFMVNRGMYTRYFATAELRDQAAPAVNAMVDKIIEANHAVNEARKAERYREKMAAKPPKPERAPKEPKPPRVVKPKKACMPANVIVKDRSNVASFRDQPAIIPPHVKKQVCPSGVDSRFTFHPPKGWVGGFTAEWIEKRNNNQRMKTGLRGANHDGKE